MTEQNYISVSEFAKNYATNLKRSKGIFINYFFTGRVLVKEQFEHILVPNEYDYDTLFQYFGPELRKIGRPVLKFLSNVENVEDELKAELLKRKRILAINLDYKEGNQAIKVYDSKGLIE